MQAKIRQKPLALGRAPDGTKMLVLGLLLAAGAAMAMPAMASGAVAGRGGRITFSGAVTVPTCGVPAAAGAAGVPAPSSAQMACSGNTTGSRAVYHVVTEAIPDRSGIRLLEYARDKYSDALLVTYSYD